MLLCPGCNIAHSPLCTSSSVLKLKKMTKADLYMPCEAMAHSTKSASPIHSITLMTILHGDNNEPSHS
jgi:hypothetical protein